MKYIQMRHVFRILRITKYVINNLKTEKNEKVNFNNISDCRVHNNGT
jgi:hypothetical protein